MKVIVEKQIGENVLSFETGQWAKQAGASVIVRYGDTVVLCAVTSGSPRQGIDFFPLTCDYRERTAAAGKFPGGFMKREGRPTLKETLTSRLVDRPIRPLFTKGFKDEVQVQSIVLASDRQNDGDVLAMNGSSLACYISPMPFEGPLASVRIGRVEGQLIVFPTQDQLEVSDLDLIISGGEKDVAMIEGFAREMPEDEMVDAIAFGHDMIRQVCQLQREMYEKLGVQKAEFVPEPENPVLGTLKEKYYDRYKTAKLTDGKQARAEAVAVVREAAQTELIPDPKAEGAISDQQFQSAWHDLEECVIRDLILSGTRPDSRDYTTLREIVCDVDVLPRVHGSALFQRGETQALITVTLGTSRDEQRVDGLIDEYSKKFMLDYNFPSFSVGECRPNRGPGRREFGHGALAERSIKPVLPDPESFPYTIRVISDILESNGSSSMASVCGATLGLMTAGVQISNPVAGISVGLVQEGDRWVLLTDIIGDEDHFGDMDFKVAGTQNGITGIQLDLKIKGIGEEIIRAALKQSREARIEILRKMLMAISRPKSDISEFAPRLEQTRIDPDKIGMLIGPGGKNIRAIQERTETVIEVDNDGLVTISAADGAKVREAILAIEACTATVQIGKIYEGTVASIKDFGAFIEILPGRDGLCHISELSEGYISNVEDVCKLGDVVHVKVIEVDDHDRVKLSRRQALVELGLEDEFAGQTAPEGGGDRGGDRGDRGGDRGDRSRRGGSGGGGRPRQGSGGRGGSGGSGGRYRS